MPPIVYTNDKKPKFMLGNLTLEWADYYEEVKSYKILSFRGAVGEGKKILERTEGGLFGPSYRFTLEEMLKGEISVEDGSYEIYSVKYEGGVTTLGDLTKAWDEKYATHKIVEFIIDEETGTCDPVLEKIYSHYTEMKVGDVMIVERLIEGGYKSYIKTGQKVFRSKFGYVTERGFTHIIDVFNEKDLEFYGKII